tara:strand:+ start:544 stop:1071 length:528 start_codon:yes stop_codon:yes gene_type:complete
VEIPKDTVIEKLISDAQHIAERSKHPLAWHAFQQLERLMDPLHTAADRQAAYDAVAYLFGRPGFSYGTPAYDGAIADADALELATFRYITDGDPICAEARAFGAGAVDTAIDQAYAYATMDDALYSHHQNAHDTLGEVFHSLRGDGRYQAAWHALEAGFRDALAERGMKLNGLTD